MADADQRLRLARGQLAGIVGAARVQHRPGDLRQMAGDACGLARGRKLRVGKQLAPELHQRLVFDRPGRGAPVLVLQSPEHGRRGLRTGHVNSDRGSRQQPEPPERWSHEPIASSLPPQKIAPADPALCAGRLYAQSLASGPPPNGFKEHSRQSDRLKGIPMMYRGLLREAAEHHARQAAGAARDLRRHGADRDARGAIGRKAVDAGRDRRIGDRGEAMLGRKRERRAIAGREQIVLALVAAAPDRADRVDDVLGLEPIAARDLGRAGRRSRRACGTRPSSSGPAARWMAPSTPPPPSSERFAALTMASTASVVMSATQISSPRRADCWRSSKRLACHAVRPSWRAA